MERPTPSPYAEPFGSKPERERDWGTGFADYETEHEEVAMEEGPLAETIDMGEDDDFDDLGPH
jgi:hypothetical protein